MTCTCRPLYVGLKPAGAKELDLDCPVHGARSEDIDCIEQLLANFGITLEHGEFVQRDGSTLNWFLRITDPDRLMLKAANAYVNEHRKP